MDLGDFRTRVMGTIFGGNSGTEEQALVDGWVNEGVVDVLMRTHCFVDESNFVTTSGTDDYSMAQNIIALNEVTMTHQGQNDVLERKTPREILHLRQYGGSSSTGQSTSYAVQGGDTFMFYPAPTGQTVTYWYVPKPTPLTNVLHDPSAEIYGGIASEYHSAIEYYALWRAAEYDDHVISNYGEKFRVRYEGENGRGGRLAVIRYSMIRKGGRSLSPISLNRRRSFSTDPSVYPRAY